MNPMLKAQLSHCPRKVVWQKRAPFGGWLYNLNCATTASADSGDICAHCAPTNNNYFGFSRGKQHIGSPWGTTLSLNSSYNGLIIPIKIRDKHDPRQFGIAGGPFS
jgi:hypothetical protein